MLLPGYGRGPRSHNTLAYALGHVAAKCDLLMVCAIGAARVLAPVYRDWARSGEDAELLRLRVLPLRCTVERTCT